MSHFLLCFYLFCLSEAVYYDTFYGIEISAKEYRRHEKDGTAGTCAIFIEECNAEEGRRVDGSCNNLKHPSRGARSTPNRRLLPPVFYNVTEPRKAKSGQNLPLSRRVRTALISEGRVPNQRFTHLVTSFWVFAASDHGFPPDTSMYSKYFKGHDNRAWKVISLTNPHVIMRDFKVNYMKTYPHCCSAKGPREECCVPNKIPDDDPVHRFSSFRCQNMTRPISFQNSGCLPFHTTPERRFKGTPASDLSNIYGSTLNTLMEKGRLFRSGQLKYEAINGRIWPPTLNNSQAKSVCLANQEGETYCFDIPEPVMNSLHGMSIMTIWFWRHHNLLANKLEKLNPCWDDEKLFEVARDINIAIYLQIYYYELLPLVLGRKNLLQSGVITSDSGFRDIYNKNLFPQLSVEYSYVLRWVHLMQEGRLKLYDTDGYYVKQFPLVNSTLRTGWLATGNNIDLATQGHFRQAAGNDDYIVDPDMAGIGLGSLQATLDILTNDNAKSRYYGLAPYIKYKEYCTGSSYEKFSDLSDSILQENIERLKDVYEDVEDIELLAGIWMEKRISGGIVPPTFNCVVTEQLKHNVVSDRHWYERENRPNAFTLEQLLEIRKANIARLLCNVGDTVTEIQPNSFLRSGPGNQIDECSKTTMDIDINVWKDKSCSRT